MRRGAGLLIAAAGLWVGLAAAAAAPITGQQPAPVTEAVLRETAEQVLARQEDLSRIWPDFWPARQPFILHEPSVGAVFAGSAAPDGPEYRPGALPGALSTFELDYPSGVANTVALNWGASDDGLATLFHEQFHDYQQDAFRWIGGGGDEFIPPNLIPDRADFAARAEIERRVLAAALLEPSPARRRQLARSYLLLRHARQDALAPELAAAEAHREWSEGTAEYVGLLGAAVVTDSPTALRDNIVSGLRKDLMSQRGDYMSNWFRWRAYDVGAAIAWLLDDLATDWRLRVENGERLDRLLAEALGSDSAPADAVALLAGHGFDALVTDLSSRLLQAPAAVASREEFLATAPKRLVIEIVASPLMLGGVGTSFQSREMTPLPGNAIALPNAVYFVMQLGAYELDVRGRSVLSEQTQEGFPREIILLDSFDELGELADLPPGVHPRDSLTVSGGGVRLTAGQTRIEVGPDEILLRIQP